MSRDHPDRVEVEILQFHGETPSSGVSEMEPGVVPRIARAWITEVACPNAEWHFAAGVLTNIPAASSPP